MALFVAILCPAADGQDQPAAGAGGSGAVASSGAATAPAKARRPNIIVILSDDMGYSDLGCYGGEMRTPNLDRLASTGLRFTQFYNTGRCCPTRASLLTGLYPHQAGVGHMVQDKGLDGYRGELSPAAATIAQALKPAGYASYAVGKWHVTTELPPRGAGGAGRNWPLQRGFDRYYGTIVGGGNYFDPAGLVRDNKPITIHTDPEYKADSYYYTHAISDQAIRYVGEHRKNSPDKPFFLYVAYTAAHWPMHAPEADIARQKGRFDAGYDALRRQRFARMKEMGLLKSTWALSPTEGDLAKQAKKEWELRCMEVYAAMIDTMDQGIGRLVESLRASGQLDDTLIFYLQDNGGCQEGVGRAPRTTRQPAPTLPPIALDAIFSDSRPKQTRAGFPMLTGNGVMPGPEDTFIAYGQNWANVSNTPFRQFKHYVHEGGIATPLIVHWPAGIKARGGLRHQPGHLIDIMATCLDVAGAAPLRQIGGQAIKPPEGLSLIPAFADEPLASRPLFWEHEGNRAVRQGRWKLVALENKPWELYDMEADRSEMFDLAAGHPEKVMELQGVWDSWATRANVLPLGSWRNKARGPSNEGNVFTLQQGDDLQKAESPDLARRGFSVEIQITDLKPDGVLIAQGGRSHGFSIYLKDSIPHFALRRNSQLTTVKASAAIKGPGKLSFRLGLDGAATFTLDGTPLGGGKTPGPLLSKPVEGLQIGQDAGAPVGEYGFEPVKYGGKIGGVGVKVE